MMVSGTSVTFVSLDVTFAVALSRFGITGVISLGTLNITVTIDGSSIISKVVGQVLLPVF
jgi:hypothetical protein